MIVDLESGEMADLGIQGVRAFYPGDEDLFYVDSRGALMVVRFDPARRLPAGAPVAVMDGVSLTREDVPALDISKGRSMVYSEGFVLGSRIIPSEIVRLDVAGKVTVLPFQPEQIGRGIAVSPSGDRLTASMRDGSIWIYDLHRGTRIRLPSGEALSTDYPVWDPGSLRVAFGADFAGGGFAIFQQPANGREPPEPLLVDARAELHPGSWTPEGKGIVYVHYDGSLGVVSIRIMDVGKAGESRTVVTGRNPIRSVRLSPDGRWIAYDAAETGDFEIYVQDVSGSSERLVLSSGGGTHPQWSPDGRQLYYHSAGRLMAVSAPRSRGERFGRPRTILETDIEREFSVDPQGGFYGYRPVPGTGIQKHLKLIVNWVDPLRRPGA